MFRPWTLLAAAGAMLWALRFAGWSRSGTWYPLTVGDVLDKLGVPPLHPPPTDWGEIAGNILDTDGGFFCLLLAMAALAVEASISRNR
ncbi:MAG: hypothetical protein M0006_12380 [Magnetospirillum sp.]|nr:hypothetical protein [Magnetospirillum sp.]